MPTDPFPFSGHVYDIDRTVEADATVKITNSRTGAVQTQVTNSAGEYVFDFANFTGEYATNDLVYVQAWKSGTPFKIVSTTVLVEGSSVSKSLYLRAVYNKRIHDIGWNDEKQESHAHDLGATKITSVESDRVDLTYDSSGNCTQIVEYTKGVRRTFDLTWTSGNCSKIEVS